MESARRLHNLPAAQATSLQVETNDGIAEMVNAHPDRFQGFATLAMRAPDAAARELERAVTELGLNCALLFGRTGQADVQVHNVRQPSWRRTRSLGRPYG
jgi:predicted TIM-barrel fold metal-dependent hydrolase